MESEQFETAKSKACSARSEAATDGTDLPCFAEIATTPARAIERDHGGTGRIVFRRLLDEYDFTGAVDFVDFTIVPPGSSIGLHEHHGTEELYFVAAGEPLVEVDGCERRLSRGDVAIVHSGQAHRLINDRAEAVEILVIQVGHSRLPPAADGR
jgi:mannose-6-phosphate isomerase-like protein (cupin superfamily)